MKGKLITIEGIDGSGKNTQTRLLQDKLVKQGRKVKIYSFPCYEDTFFGNEIGKFLRGEYGSLEQVHPKLASLLFAGDRFENRSNMLADLGSGTDVICDRYVESNIAHQCAKLPEQEHGDFKEWVENLEYKVYALPRPNLTIFLDVPLDVSKELVLKKEKRIYTEEKEDIHEGDHGYLERVYRAYQALSSEYSWKVVSCVENKNIRRVEDISEELSQLVFSELI